MNRLSAKLDQIEQVMKANRPLKIVVQCTNLTPGVFRGRKGLKLVHSNNLRTLDTISGRLYRQETRFEAVFIDIHHPCCAISSLELAPER